MLARSCKRGIGLPSLKLKLTALVAHNGRKAHYTIAFVQNIYTQKQALIKEKKKILTKLLETLSHYKFLKKFRSSYDNE